MARNMAVPAPAAPPRHPNSSLNPQICGTSGIPATKRAPSYQSVPRSREQLPDGAIRGKSPNPGSPAQAKPRAGKPSSAVPQARIIYAVYVNPKGTDAGAHAKQAQATRGGAAQNPGQGFGNAPLPQQAPRQDACRNASTGDNITSKESAEELPNENTQTRSTSQSSDR